MTQQEKSFRCVFFVCRTGIAAAFRDASQPAAHLFEQENGGFPSFCKILFVKYQK